MLRWFQTTPFQLEWQFWGNKTEFNSQGSHMYFKDIEADFTFKLHLLRQCFTPINLSKNSWEFPVQHCKADATV